MPILTHCPSCSRALRVPDELVGSRVKCSQCATVFVAAAGSESPAGGAVEPSQPPVPQPRQEAPPAREYDDRLHDEYEDQARQRSLRESRREAARSKLEAPGIAMLIVNGLNVVVALGLLIWGFASLPDASKDMQQARQNAANRNQRVRQPGEANAHDTGFAIGFYAGRLGPHFCGGLLGIAGSIVGFIGGARMLQARSLTTARLAAIVTMIPCTSPACILGLPVGLWALVALSSPEVKRLG